MEKLIHDETLEEMDNYATLLAGYLESKKAKETSK